jgi:lipopolysaccharide export system protein LptC
VNRSWLIAALLLLAVASGALVWWLRPTPPPPVVVARADYILRDYQMVALQRDGAEGFSVRGPLLTRDPQGRHVTLTTPRMSLPDAKGRIWTASAAEAGINHDQTEVRLQGDVRIDGPAEGQRASAQFRSDQLTVYPERDEARSDATVTIAQGDSILRGTGLSVDLETSAYVLEHDVHARLVPGARPAVGERARALD